MVLLGTVSAVNQCVQTQQWIFMKRLNTAPTLLLLLTTLFWGGNAVASQFAVGHISPMMVTFLRWLFASLFLLILYGKQVRAAWQEAKNYWRLILLMSFLGFTGFNAIFYVAAQSTGAINIGILQGAIPVLVVLGSLIFYRASVTFKQVCGILLTLPGVVIIASKGDISTLRSLNFNIGDILMLGACALYSGYTLLIRKRPKMEPQVFMTLLSFFALGLSLPLLFTEVISGQFFWPTSQGWLVALYAGFIVSALSQLFFIRATDIVGPVKAGVYVNLVPLIAAFLSVILLGEHFELYHAVALTMVMSGIYLAQKKA